MISVGAPVILLGATGYMKYFGVFGMFNKLIKRDKI